MHEDTIAALSSGGLPSGVAIVRISGAAAATALQALAGPLPEPRRASLRRVRDGRGATIDRGIVLFFPGPGSVTGEDLAEIHLHGGRAVVAACLDALTAIPSVRLAEAGEFTRRAFENGRIDLTEAEGLADLLAAETEGQRAAAVAQAGGGLRTIYEGWMRRVTQARAMIEASFDFAEEDDVGDDVTDRLDADLARLADEMRDHLHGARRGEILRHGYRVAIVGPPNAGKSSLINALAERDVAIVSSLPGTTRDVIEVTLDLGGLPVRFFDTAGLRETADVIEAIGVARARKAMEEADLVLLLDEMSSAALTHVKQPTGTPPCGVAGERPSAKPLLRVRSKSDLGGNLSEDLAGGFDFAISSLTGAGLSDLTDRIAALAAEAAGSRGGAIPIRTRHREIVADAATQLQDYLGEDNAPAEVRSEILRQVSDRLGALTGRIGVEDLLGVIFAEFCIGK